MVKPKLRSVLKWVGLYFLANFAGGILEWALGIEPYGAVLSAGVLLFFIVVAVRKTRRTPRARADHDRDGS